MGNWSQGVSSVWEVKGASGTTVHVRVACMCSQAGRWNVHSGSRWRSMQGMKEGTRQGRMLSHSQMLAHCKCEKCETSRVVVVPMEEVKAHPSSKNNLWYFQRSYKVKAPFPFLLFTRAMWVCAPSMGIVVRRVWKTYHNARGQPRATNSASKTKWRAGSHSL